MIYEQSRSIERRLEKVLRLIRTGRYSTPTLAEEVGVSIPTVSRCVNALKERGHEIKAEKGSDGWRYILEGSSRTSKSLVESRFVEVSE